MATINIVFTSYPRRITNCASVIRSVLDNSIVPDRIYLTLSHKQFPNYEQNIPKELHILSMTSNRVIINWVEDDYKSMKKVFPVLPYLEDDDIIIDIDDDMMLPKDFIESRIKDFKDNGCMHPITSNLHNSVNLDNMVMSCYSLFQKKMLNGYDKFLTKEVLDTFNDDRTYLYLCHMNGYKLKPCTKWCVGDGYGRVIPLDIAPHGDYQYAIGTKYDKLVSNTISKLSNGRQICDCFNLFNDSKSKQKSNHLLKRQIKENSESSSQHKISQYTADVFQYGENNHGEKHDLVYVLGSGSKHDNLEIKISITSMLKYCSDWIGNIYVVGENPKIHNERVKFLSCPDITSHNKDANIIYKILQAINGIPSLTQNFLFCSDDILVTKKSSWEDFAPRYVFEYIQNEQFRRELFNESKDNPWDRLLLKTLDRFIGYREHIYFYEPHIFAPINKKYFKKMCGKINYMKDKNNIIMSLWFNWMNLQKPSKRYDHTSIFSPDEIPFDMSTLNQNRHLTYNDSAFNVKSFRDKLIKMVTMDEFK